MTAPGKPGGIRVVIDTCALVAARFAPDGAASQLIDLCIEGLLQAVVTNEIEQENRDILGKVRPPRTFLTHLGEFYSSAVRVEADRRLEVVEDPADNKYLECALAGRAGCIITSDRHLLAHDGFEGIRICRAGRFLALIDRAGRGKSPITSIT